MLAALLKRGVALDLTGVYRLIAACAMDDAATIRELAQREPQLVAQLLAQGATLLAEFSSTWNTAGVRRLLDLGVDALMTDVPARAAAVLRRRGAR